MLNYILKRIGLMVLTALIITIIVFVMIRLMPDIDKPMLGTDPDAAARIKARDGLNEPIPVQFFMWVKNIVTDGYFGWSELKQREASEVLMGRLPETIKINIVPTIISIPIGFGLGIFAALKKNKLSDQIISIGVVVFISVPMFVVASLLKYYFAYELQWLPDVVSADVDVQANPIKLFTSRILPILSLTFGSVATYTRFTRAELTEVLTSEFMLLCRTKGLTRRQATIRHAMRNSMVPLAPMIIGNFIAVLAGSLIIERIYRINGVGGIYLQSFTARDYSLVMLVVMFYTLIGLASTLLVDISYSIVDPRIRLGGGKRAF